MADLGDAIGAVYAHQRKGADRPAARPVDDCMMQGVVARRHAFEMRAEDGGVREWADVQVGPVALVRRFAVRLVEILGMTVGIDGLDAAVTPVDGRARRFGPSGPIGQGRAYGLSESVGQRWHVIL